MVGLSRFELLTPRLSSVCSNQLSYRPSSSTSPLVSPHCQRTGTAPILSKLDRRACDKYVRRTPCQIDLRLAFATLDDLRDDAVGGAGLDTRAANEDQAPRGHRLRRRH